MCIRDRHTPPRSYGSDTPQGKGCSRHRTEADRSSYPLRFLRANRSAVVTPAAHRQFRAGLLHADLTINGQLEPWSTLGDQLLEHHQFTSVSDDKHPAEECSFTYSTPGLSLIHISE